MSGRINPEKKRRLLKIRERLLDVYLEEADPGSWTDEEKAREQAAEMVAGGGSAKEAAKLLANWKGERYWEKKNANQTMTMLIQIGRYLEQAEGGQAPAEEEGLEKEIRKAERAAKKRLARSRPALKKIEGGKK